MINWGLLLLQTSSFQWDNFERAGLENKCTL